MTEIEIEELKKTVNGSILSWHTPDATKSKAAKFA